MTIHSQDRNEPYMGRAAAISISTQTEVPMLIDESAQTISINPQDEQVGQKTNAHAFR
jgi:hypothetical protein